MFIRICLVLTIVLLSGCNSTEQANTDDARLLSSPNFTIDSAHINTNLENHALTKVNDFQNADYYSIIQPYLNGLNQIDSLTPEQMCEPEYLQLFDKLLSLNPGSIHIPILKLGCTKNLLSDEEYFNKLSSIVDVAAVLIARGNGETVSSAMQIRELSEVFTLFELAGARVLDTEIEFHDGILYYKLHLWDSEKNQFSYRYASNVKFFKTVFSGLGNLSVSQKQTSQILYDALLDVQVGTALNHKFQELALEEQYQDILNFQSAVEDTAVGQVRLAQAALMLNRDDVLDLWLDNILSYAELGLIEANGFIAHFLFIKDPEQSWSEIQTELAKIDAAAGEGVGMQVFLNSLSFRSDFNIQLEKLMTISNHKVLAGIQHYTEFLQAVNDSSPLDYSARINDIMTLLAKHDDPKAKLYLARQIFNQDNPSPEDIERAHDLLNSAAEDGYDEAQLSLGFKYGNGEDGYVVNREKAFELYQLAAEQNNKYALHNVAAYYRDGLVGDVNLDKAIHYFEKSVEAGYVKAYCLIGEIYRTKMTPPDYINAEKQFSLGFSKLKPDQLNSCYEGQGMIEKFVNKNPEKAEVYLQAAADQGNGFAAYQLAMMYHFPEYEMQDFSKARTYYERAIELGHHAAGGNLGYMYETGEGDISASNSKALEYYQMGAKVEDPQAMNNLATFYYHGIEIEQDIPKAVSLYKQAAHMGNGFAAYNYADHLGMGEYVPADYLQACNYYEMAYEQQYLKAYLYYAFCHSDGVGRYKNLDKALQILEEGIALGDETLGYDVAEIYIEKQQVEKAEAYLLRSAKAGMSVSYVKLGELYREQKRYKEALNIYQLGVENGKNLQHLIAQMQWLGLGMEQNKEKAIASFKQIALEKSHDVNHYLAYNFLYNFKNPPQYELAFNYYSQIKEPNSNALNSMGNMYRSGWHVNRDLEKAATFYQQSATANNSDAHFALGEMYRDGEHYSQSFEKAAHHFLQAAEMELETAMIELSKLYLKGHITEPADKGAEYWLKEADWKNDENILLLTELLLSKSDQKAKKEAFNWLTLGLQSQTEGIQTLMQKFGITKDDLLNE